MPDLSIRALGTQVRATGNGAFVALREVQRLEKILTRFAPSALTQLNSAGELQRPPIELVLALRHALKIAQETGGWITPTILPALEAAGYTTAPGAGATQSPAKVPDIQGITVQDDLIQLPAGVRLDLGGTAKSWIAREAARFLSGRNLLPSLLDAGGDLIVSSPVPTTIGIETPDSQPAYLNLPAGRFGVATSSVLKRAWAGGHHLISPRTGASAQTTFAQVTAVAQDVTVAETLAKLALLDAQDVLQDWLQLYPARLMAFDRDGQGLEWKWHTWTRWAA